ncbi:MAG TPA: hypothetical protein VD905_00595 [Flavobacteriales bacterium]|nr:hypothetical protein [Flavobacteriales bacterium]
MGKLLLAFLVLTLTLAKSQDCSVIEKPGFGLLKRVFGVPAVVALGEPQTYYATYVSGLGKKTVASQQNDKWIEHEFGSIKINGSKRWPMQTFTFRNKLYMLYGEYRKRDKLNVFFAYELNQQTLNPVGEPKKLYEFAYESKMEIFAAFNTVQISPAGANALVFWFATPQQKGGTTLHFFYCNQHLEPVKSPVYELGASREIRQTIMTPSGSLYFLVLERSIDNGTAVGSPFKLLKIGIDGNVKTEPVGLFDKNMEDAKLLVNKNEELTIAGYCSGDDEPYASSVFNAVVDTASLEINHVKVASLNLVNMSEKTNGTAYFLKDVVYDASGNLFVLGEEYERKVAYHEDSNGETSESVTFIYGDVLVSCIPANTFEVKTKWVMKQQRTSPSETPFASYCVKPCNKGISLIMNALVEGTFTVDRNKITNRELSSTVTKMVSLDVDLEKNERLFLCGMQERAKENYTHGYSCHAQLLISNCQFMPDGSVILFSKTGSASDYFLYVWR